jgi:hypothetical protein
VVLGALLFLGVGQAAHTLGLEMVAEIAHGLLAGLFQILVACSIFAVGLWASRAVGSTVAEWERGRDREGTPLASVARGAVLTFAGAMALGQTGLAPEILHLVIGAAALGLAIALGLAFGLGGRDHASRWLDSRHLGDS